jgi:hypothetical protein
MLPTVMVQNLNYVLESHVGDFRKYTCLLPGLEYNWSYVRGIQAKDSVKSPP